MSKKRARARGQRGRDRVPPAARRQAHFLLIKDSYQHWGFPKGHLEEEESPADAALRETAEETGLGDLVLHGPIRIIDWHFRFRGRHIHKYCHFFLFESPAGEVLPQEDEGITDHCWLPLEEALERLSYDNARGVLRRGGEMSRTLVAVGAGRPSPRRGRLRGRLTVAAIAALLDSRGAVTALRRSLLRGGPGVVSRRAAADLRRTLNHRVVEAVVFAPRPGMLEEFSSLRAEFPAIPVVAYAPFRPDDGDVLAVCHRHRVAAVAVEGVDDAVIGELVRRASLAADGPCPGRRAPPAPADRAAPTQRLGDTGAAGITADADPPPGTTAGCLPRAPVAPIRGGRRSQPQASH